MAPLTMRLQRGGSLRRFVPMHVPPTVSKQVLHSGGSLARFQPTPYVGVGGSLTRFTPYTGVGGGLALPERLKPFTPGGLQKTIKKRAKRKLANAVVDAVMTTLNKKAKKTIDNLFS